MSTAIQFKHTPEQARAALSAARSYRIRTWDMELQEFTPQCGVPEYVTGFRGLRKAISLLRKCGYSADRIKHGGNDPSVLIELEQPADAKPAGLVRA